MGKSETNLDVEFPEATTDETARMIPYAVVYLI